MNIEAAQRKMITVSNGSPRLATVRSICLRCGTLYLSRCYSVAPKGRITRKQPSISFLPSSAWPPSMPSCDLIALCALLRTGPSVSWRLQQAQEQLEPPEQQQQQRQQRDSSEGGHAFWRDPGAPQSRGLACRALR